MNEHEPEKITMYGEIRSIKFSRSREYGKPVRDTLTVTLCGDLLSDDEQTVEFYDVEQLHIGCLGMLQSIALYASDISDRGYEKLKYYVTDDEEDTLSFYCTGYKVI